MHAYRAYFLDQDDHITGTEVIEAASLRGAIDIAMGMLKGLPRDQFIELWEGEKRCCSLPPDIYRTRAHLLANAPSPDRFAAGLKLESTEMSAISSRLAAASEAANSSAVQASGRDNTQA
jgi:hypothetical protein